MSIYEFLEDFDNEELSNHEWNEQMEEAVHQYNNDYYTDHAPKSTIKNYLSWKREKNSIFREED